MSDIQTDKLESSLKPRLFQQLLIRMVVEYDSGIPTIQDKVCFWYRAFSEIQ